MILPPSLSNTDVPRNGAEASLFKKLTLIFGLLAILASITGLIGNISDTIIISSVCQGCKTLALSAALTWIFFGAVLVYISIKPLRRFFFFLLRAVLLIIACTEFIDIILILQGAHFIIESWFVTTGSMIFGPLSSPISPVASGLIIIAAVGMFFCIDPAFLSSQRQKSREITAGSGIIISLTGFTLVLSYLYGSPLLYGTPVIPIAAFSALSAFFIGFGLIAAAGPATAPACYFMGDSIRARLSRTFVSLTVVITFCETILFSIISAWFSLSNVVMISASLVIFIIVTSIIVGRLSVEIGQSLDKAEQALADKNEDFGELNEELMAVEEELRQNIDALTKNERDLRESERFLRETEKLAKLSGWKANPQTDYLQVTDGFYDIIEAPLHYPPGFTAGLSYFSGKDRPLIRNCVEKCLATGESFTLELLVTTGTGKNVWTELRGLRPVTEGSRTAVIGTFQDISDRKLAEEKLREEGGKLNILAESARLLMSAENPEHIVYVVGEQVMQFLHCHTFFNYLIDESGQRMQLNAYAGITPEDAERIHFLNLGEAVCGQVARNAERMTVSGILNRDDEMTGLIRSFGTNAYACHPLIYQGRTIGTLSFGTCDRPSFLDDELDLMRAVTDLVATAMARKKIEDTLRSTSQYLESLINYANAPIIVWDTKYRILRFNRSFEFLTGMAADTVIGQSLEILFPEKSRSESMELIQKTSSGERWESVEIPIQHISGATRIVLWNSANLLDADGVTISSTIAQGQDITERKIAEESAIKTASLLHAALDATADGILVVDNARNITSYNKKFCVIWGIPEHLLDSAEEAAALAYMTPLVTDCREFVDRRNELYAHPGRESYDVVSLRDGRIFERYSKSQKIFDTIVGRVWSYRDITERRQAEEALQESLENFRIIATHTPDQILVQDKDLRYMQVINPQWGLTEQEMIKNTDYDLFSKEDADNITRLKKQVLASGTAVRSEMSLINARGEKNYFDISYVPEKE